MKLKQFSIYNIFIPIVSLIVTIICCPLPDNYFKLCHCGILISGVNYIECDRQSLRVIPPFKRSFPYDDLILSHNLIENLTQNSFDNIKGIRRIYLDNNPIQFIDNDVLRLLGNYLEDFIISANNKFDSLEFLFRYPLKKLRLLKLTNFNLKNKQLTSTLFSNMTRLEILYIQNCQLKTIDFSQYSLNNLYTLDLQDNQLSYLNLKSVISLKNLNLANNHIHITKDLNINSIDGLPTSLINIDLSTNRINDFDLFRNLNKLQILSLNNNSLKQLPDLLQLPLTLKSFDLSLNQLKTINNSTKIFFEQLTNLNLQNNPLECDCHLKWLYKLVIEQKQRVNITNGNDDHLIDSIMTNNDSFYINPTKWTCSDKKQFLSSDFQCILIPKLILFNLTYIQANVLEQLTDGLLLQWQMNDLTFVNYYQISYELDRSQLSSLIISNRLSKNMSQLFITNILQYKRYHVCLIIYHKFAKDKYCRDILTINIVKYSSQIILSNQLLTNLVTILPSSSPLSLNQQTNSPTTQIMLIGSCIGVFLTLILLFTCIYLCCKIKQFNRKHSKSINIHQDTYHPPPSRRTTTTFTCCEHHDKHQPYCSAAQLFNFQQVLPPLPPPPYPTSTLYHHHPHHHHPIHTCQHYNTSENTSNSTDSSHLGDSLHSNKHQQHIYQEITNNNNIVDNNEQKMFDLWNMSVSTATDTTTSNITNLSNNDHITPHRTRQTLKHIR
ncbi:unnamed protein product [Didymodactylos carnosus]|uniref:Uncharacterized protein n=1 Tax=Didymodactylos carnosus TaxID=1234261 RepID=A0A813T022_9BILA|nr:unnamed protein product [Didymodactylos carnosus]CAF3593241.1 unnamed protein product [Didymodactylos carnosus]